MYFQESYSLWYVSDKFGKNAKNVNKKEDSFQDGSKVTNYRMIWTIFPCPKIYFYIALFTLLKQDAPYNPHVCLMWKFLSSSTQNVIKLMAGCDW